MSAAHVRRGEGGAKRPRRASRKVAVPKKLAAKLPVHQDSANRLARWMFGLFAAAAVALALVALEVPAKIGIAAGEALGEAGFRVRSVDVKGVRRMDSEPVYAIATDQQSMAMPLVDVADIRERLLQYGWVKDARVSRRLPDTLVIDIVERDPAAMWQNGDKLSLIDAEGVVLDRVPISAMPDLPLVIGAGANNQSRNLDALLKEVPTLAPQLESATWVGRRRWDLQFQTGESIALPEGQEAAKTALVKFAKLDSSAGLLGRGILRFDLRIPGKMTVRLPRGANEPIVPPTATES